jgi:hypothetical protein
MPITMPAPPATGPDLVRKAISAFRRRGTEAGQSEPQYLDRAIPIFALDVDALGLVRPTDAARQVGWRYFAQHGGEPAMVDLGGVEATDLRFHALRRGARAERMLQATVVAEQGADDQELAARILTLPQLHLEALWLRGDDADVFIRTKAPQNSAVEPFDFLTEARRLANRRDRPGASSAEDRGG